MDQSLNINQFSLLSVIGQGKFSTVFLCRQKSNGKYYALKTISKSLIKKRQMIQRIIQEKTTLQSCVNFRFITNLHYTFQSRKNAFFVLDYCPGGDLFNLLFKKKSFSEPEAKFYVAQIVLAIEYLHFNNIIYRDLKPENILLDKNGYIKLADFGYSKSEIEPNKTTDSFCGTFQYMAPEIILKQSHGRPVDIWTLGCLVYELIYGSPPFNDCNQKILFDGILNREFDTSQKKISNQLKDFLKNTLDKNQQERINIQEVKRHPWLSKIEWNSIEQQLLAAFYVPVLKRATDISNFDLKMTNKDAAYFIQEEDEEEELHLVDFSFEQ